MDDPERTPSVARTRSRQRVLLGAALGATVLACVIVDAAFGRPPGALSGLLAISTALWTLAAILRAFVRRGRRRFLVPALLVWWFAVELLAPPWMVDAFPLVVNHYRIIRDVDHRPTLVGGEWNSDSLRGTAESNEFRNEDLNILFLGDSFTMGAGVMAVDAFPTVVGGLLSSAHPEKRIRVANFGWLSSSPFLSWRRLVDLGERYKPDIVVLCVDMSDFQEDIRYRQMVERRGMFALFDKIPITLRLFRLCAPDAYPRVLSWSVGGAPQRRYFVTDAPLEETRRWLEPIVASIDGIHGWCSAHGAEFVLVLLPRYYQYSAREVPNNAWESNDVVILGPYCLEPFRFLDELRVKADYPIVSLLSDFQHTDVFPTCFDNDPHWTVAGHRVAAQAIARELEPVVRGRLSR